MKQKNDFENIKCADHIPPRINATDIDDVTASIWNRMTTTDLSPGYYVFYSEGKLLLGTVIEQEGNVLIRLEGHDIPFFMSEIKEKALIKYWTSLDINKLMKLIQCDAWKEGEPHPAETSLDQTPPTQDEIKESLTGEKWIERYNTMTETRNNKHE